MNNPYDKLFKAVLSNRASAIAYLKYFLPKEILSELSFKDLKEDPTSYLSKKLKNFFSDICYNCRFGKSGQEVKITFLFEHKSSPSQKIHLQLLE